MVTGADGYGEAIVRLGSPLRRASPGRILSHSATAVVGSPAEALLQLRTGQVLDELADRHTLRPSTKSHVDSRVASGRSPHGLGDTPGQRQQRGRVVDPCRNREPSTPPRARCRGVVFHSLRGARSCRGADRIGSAGAAKGLVGRREFNNFSGIAYQGTLPMANPTLTDQRRECPLRGGGRE